MVHLSAALYDISHWHAEWNQQVSFCLPEWNLLQNKLHMIKPFLVNRRAQGIKRGFMRPFSFVYASGIRVLLMGTSCAGRSFLNEYCREDLSVLCILLECPAYDEKRRRCFSQLYRKHPFTPRCLWNETLLPDTQVFEFLKSTNLLRKM